MRKKHLRLLATALSLAGLLLIIYSSRKTVHLVVDGEVHTITTQALRVSDLLESAEVVYDDQDILKPPASSWLRDGDTITLDHTAQVVIRVGGETHTLVTAERLPANLLALTDQPLYPDDLVFVDGETHDPDQPLTPSRQYVIEIQRATRIKLVEGDQEHSFTSTARTLGEALNQEGITLISGDLLKPPPKTILQPGTLEAELKRSQQIKIVVQGETIITRTTASSVGKALADVGLPLQGLDYSQPDEANKVPANKTIQVTRVREEIILENEPLPFESQFLALPEVELDTQQIVQVGAYGLASKRVRVYYEAQPDQADWEEISRKVEDEWVAREPKPRIVGYGTNIVVRSTNTPDGQIRYWRAVEVYASSYSPCRSGVPNKCYPNTSSGKPVQKGVIAVTLSWYRYMQGQRVYIPGYGFATIEDVGGGLPGQHWVDLGYSDEEWVGWGQNVTVYFLAPPPENIMWILD
ncbi:MAG: ubiquitin-like domain-containing protein [Anaerolineales bacterium]|jgi:uncharacterized protein YabE (DUF348 family)